MHRAVACLVGAVATFLVAAAPAQDEAFHPEPRVVIDVTSPKKSKVAASVQATARRTFWDETVRCYKAAAKDAPELRVDATLIVDVRNGAVKTSEYKKAKGRDRTKRKNVDAVGRCLQKKLVGLEMPAAARGFFTLQFRVRPGDKQP